MRHLIADFDAGPKSAWRKCRAIERRLRSDLLEARFWISPDPSRTIACSLNEVRLIEYMTSVLPGQQSSDGSCRLVGKNNLRVSRRRRCSSRKWIQSC